MSDLLISRDLSQREGGAEPLLSWVPSPGGPASPRFSAHSPASFLGTLSPWLCLLSPGLCSLPLGPERETPRTEGRVGSGCTELESSGSRAAVAQDRPNLPPAQITWVTLRPAQLRDHRAARVLPQAKCRAEARGPSEKRLWVRGTESPRPPSSLGETARAGRKSCHTP